jgi:hypothetical protein
MRWHAPLPPPPPPHQSRPDRTTGSPMPEPCRRAITGPAADAEARAPARRLLIVPNFAAAHDLDGTGQWPRLCDAIRASHERRRRQSRSASAGPDRLGRHNAPSVPRRRPPRDTTDGARQRVCVRVQVTLMSSICLARHGDEQRRRRRPRLAASPHTHPRGTGRLLSLHNQLACRMCTPFRLVLWRPAAAATIDFNEHEQTSR